MKEKTIIELLALAEQIKEDNPQLAINFCHQILKEKDSKQAKFILSVCLSRLNRHDEAIEISKELAINPESICNLAMTYAKAKRLDKASEEYKRAIKLDYSNKKIHSNYVLFLQNIREGKAANLYMEHLQKEIFFDEYLWYTYGIINYEMNNFIKAKECYLKSVNIKSIPIAHYNLSLTHFHLGEYKEGWKEYEYRWQACWLFEKMRNKVPGKFWQGEPLYGKSILLWCEQGIGDLILFIRYAKELEKMGATVYLKYQDPIFPYKLGETSAYSIETTMGKPTGFGLNPIDNYDYNCSILTVAGILRVDVKTATGTPYLKSTLPPLPKDNKKKIGLCWCGNPGHPKDQERSIKLKEFKLDKVYSLVKDYSLKQYEDGQIVDWSSGHKQLTIDLSSYLVDLNHTAQVIEWLDVVVTVDTVIAHLAGALGKKTYLLLSYNCDWRWWDEKKDKTPWYDSIALIRQEKIGNWQGEIDKLFNLI